MKTANYYRHQIKNNFISDAEKHFADLHINKTREEIRNRAWKNNKVSSTFIGPENDIYNLIKGTIMKSIETIMKTRYLNKYGNVSFVCTIPSTGTVKGYVYNPVSGISRTHLFRVVIHKTEDGNFEFLTAYPILESELKPVDTRLAKVG